ncbi:hypothetical protein FRC17_002832 [Serendipita sp. 399]|nr:hypothetical protein FRC17_002832 [Serendipita sp. 399]
MAHLDNFHNLNPWLLEDDASGIYDPMEYGLYSTPSIDERHHARLLSEVPYDALFVQHPVSFQSPLINYTKSSKCTPSQLTNSMIGSLGDFGTTSMSSSISSALFSSMTSSAMMSSSMLSSVYPDTPPLLAQLKQIIQEIQDSLWRMADELEPTDDKGRSIYLNFVTQDNGIYTCMFCQKKNDRQDRATGHIRKHFNHRPFRCDGACGVKSCGKKLFKSDLRQHKSHCNWKLVTSPDATDDD